MTRNLINSICIASLLGLGLAGATAQAGGLDDQFKKTPPGLPPQLGDEALGDVGPPIYLPEDDDDGFGNDAPRARCAPDVNRNGRIEFGDMLEVLLQWGDCPADRSLGNGGLGGQANDPGNELPCPADIDGDRRIGLSDLLLVLVNMDKDCGDRDVSNLP